MHFHFNDRKLNFLAFSLSAQTVAKRIYLEFDFKQAPGENGSDVHLNELAYLNSAGQRIDLVTTLQPADPLGQSLATISLDNESVPGEEQETLGDINDDGLVCWLDLDLQRKHIAELLETPLTAPEIQRADFNNDGRINIIDLLKLLDVVLASGIPFCDQTLSELDSDDTYFTNDENHLVLEGAFSASDNLSHDGVLRFTLKAPWPPGSPMQETQDGASEQTNTDTTHTQQYANIEEQPDAGLFLDDDCDYCTEIELGDGTIYNLVAGTLTMSQSNTGTRLDEDGKEISNADKLTVTFENLALQQSSDDEQVICISGPLSLSADIAQTMVTLKKEEDGDEGDDSKDSGLRGKGR